MEARCADGRSNGQLRPTLIRPYQGKRHKICECRAKNHQNGAQQEKHRLAIVADERLLQVDGPDSVFPRIFLRKLTLEGTANRRQLRLRLFATHTWTQTTKQSQRICRISDVAIRVAVRRQWNKNVNISKRKGKMRGKDSGDHE